MRVILVQVAMYTSMSMIRNSLHLVTCPCAFPLRRLAQNPCPGISVGHLPCKFPRKIPLVTCPSEFRLSAFRLRGLAQDASHGISIRHHPCKFPHRLLLVTCPCAFRLRTLAPIACPMLSIRPCAFRLRTLALNACPVRQFP